MTRILIAEDEPRIISFLEKGLKASGYTVSVTSSGTEAAAMASSEDFDLLILDLGLPGMDGFEVLAEIRGRGEQLPVVVLTARREVQSTVAALDGGANDYITKPFKFEELLARVRVALRDGVSTGPAQLSAGDISLDLRTRQVSSAGHTVELSAREFTLLETFIRHRGQVLSREQLLSQVWGYDFDPGSNIVDVYVGYLRKKLETTAIETVRGMGYRLA